MKVLLVRVGRGRCAWADAGCQDYLKRTRRKLNITELRITPERFVGDETKVRRAEGQRVLAQIKAGDRLVVLDERGEQLDTRGFAGLIDKATRESARRLVFVIGGPYGHDPLVRDKAWRTVGLSALVLNHELARVVLAEQLYRASTLLWGGSYHH